MACTICRKVGHNRRTCPDKDEYQDNEPRAKGGQPGNTNALKHGLYSKRFQPGEIELLDMVINKIDVTHEIDMMRVILNRVSAFFEDLGDEGGQLSIDETPPLLNAMTRGAQRIGHLVRIQHAIYGSDDGIEDALEKALMDVAEEMGLV